MGKSRAPRAAAVVPEASIGTDVMFDAERDSPRIFDAIAARVPVVRDMLHAFRETLPVPASTRAGMQGRFLRLPTHHRSVCMPLGADGWADPPSVEHVIVLKGTEPVLADFDGYLQWMMTARFRQSELPMGLHFPLILKMPPGAMPIDECIREQQISTAFQQQYFDRFGELARTPIPLLTHRFAQSSVDSYLARLQRTLPAQAIERIEGRIRAGLGVLVCYYEGLPLRVADALERRDGHPSLGDDGLQALGPVIESWIELFARMLSLGYLPYAHWNKGWGACVDTGNACVNGGFADLLTLVSVSTVPSERVLRASVWASLNLLVETIAAFWTSHRGGTVDEELKTLVGLYVKQELRRCTGRLDAAGHGLDVRILSCLAVDSLQDLASLHVTGH